MRHPILGTKHVSNDDPVNFPNATVAVLGHSDCAKDDYLGAHRLQLVTTFRHELVSECSWPNVPMHDDVCVCCGLLESTLESSAIALGGGLCQLGGHLSTHPVW